MKSKHTAVRKMLWLIMLANLAVAAAKTAAGISANSRSILADGIHSAADSFSNVLGLIGIHFAKKPEDRRHPYGYGKFEVIASMFIGIMLSYTALKLIISALSGIASPTAVKADTAEISVMAITLIINSAVAALEYRAGKRLSSRILITDSRHTRGDILVSCAVLLGIAAMRFGAPQTLDCVISICVAAVIMISGLQILGECAEILTDRAAVDIKSITELLDSSEDIINVHKIRSRGDSSKLFIDLHVIVRPDMDVSRAHELAHALESALRRRFGAPTEVSIHIEPDDGKH